ncbi:MAG: Rieske 2Fe-2S domain-containing protein [Syntrophorhabdus aromaticivorans]|uniref:Rieske 2Fe-2S domain-containing protein n=2 Tax=Syntrophorhabdus aromaticivorans TaxID=328301 RepID=A0A971S1Z6_9BACT|nr:Rieske 2Fe-2S domain-containing protein [Syntrophorhabdus aromaticivorans]
MTEMKIDYSLVSRRTFLNTLFGGWLLAFTGGSVYALLKFAFPTPGKEPDFVILDADQYVDIPRNSVKPFAWGGKLGFFFKNSNGTTAALKGVCTHMECNITYRPEDRKFYCACHKGWFDEAGNNIAGPPPKPLEFFDVRIEGKKLIIARKGIKVEPSKA